jgi:predicted transglutaminase-like cysteine proteinase
MPLAKKLIVCLFSTLFIFNLFSGCIFEDIFAGTNFSLKSWEISDDEGFPSLNINFTCTGTVTINIIGPNSIILDSDYYFYGDNNATFHISDYRSSVKSGQYKLIVYDNKNSKIYSKKFILQGDIVKIISCNQKWWKKDSILGNYALLGLELYVVNDGDTPAYPYNLSYVIDSKKNNSLILPNVILPGKTEYIKCFTYENTKKGEKNLTVTLNDKENTVMTSKTFFVEVNENVPIEEISWHYRGAHKCTIPKSDYLYDYYSSLDRIINEDYALFVFDLYDNSYINVLLDCILYDFSSDIIVEKINYIASMVQSIKYTSDDEMNSSYEYPRYPVETLFDRKGDCEDKSILAASLLYNLGYEVALLRLPNHMAVGVKLSKDAIPNYDFYVNDYYFLETTTSGKPCGFIPTESRNLLSNLTIHEISIRPLLIHNWENDKISIFKNTEMGNFVKVKLFVENLGIETAYNSKLTAGFYNEDEINMNSKSFIISKIDPGSKKKIILSVNIPRNEITWFKTKLYLNNEKVEEKQSASSFN